jgi:hypothetical protein
MLLCTCEVSPDWARACSLISLLRVVLRDWRGFEKLRAWNTGPAWWKRPGTVRTIVQPLLRPGWGVNDNGVKHEAHGSLGGQQHPVTLTGGGVFCI